MARQLERNVPLKIPEDPKPPVWEIFRRGHRKYHQGAMLVEHRYAMLCWATNYHVGGRFDRKDYQVPLKMLLSLFSLRSWWVAMAW